MERATERKRVDKREGWRRQLGQGSEQCRQTGNRENPEAYYSREPDPRTGNCVRKQGTEYPRGTPKKERETEGGREW